MLSHLTRLEAAPVVCALLACIPAFGGCISLNPVSLASASSPEPAMMADISGFVLTNEAGGVEFRFSEVSEVSWTSSHLSITGTIDDPRSPDHQEVRTISFPLGDVDHLLVREYRSGKSFLASTAVAIVLTPLLIIMVNTAWWEW